MKPLSVLTVLAVFSAGSAHADVLYACTFPSLPDMALIYPTDPAAKPQMQIGQRPNVEFTEGQGTNRVASASVDGFDMQFTPANSVLTVSRDGTVLNSETGHCFTINGPTAADPLKISASAKAEPGAAAPQASDATSPAADQSAAEKTADVGLWNVATDVSSLDDSTSVFLTLNATDQIPGPFGGSDFPNLILRCKEHETNLMVIVADHFLADIQGFGRIDYRMDTGKASHVNMQASTDNKALGLWSGSAAIPFIKSLMKAEKVVMRVTPFNESAVEFTFPVKGLAEAVKPLREACKW